MILTTLYLVGENTPTKLLQWQEKGESYIILF
jgi:hypothetical protein